MPEQIVLEFITDTSNIEGAIPTLEKVGKISRADAEAIRTLGTKTDTAFKSAGDSGKNAADIFSKMEKNVTNLANTLESELGKALKDQLQKSGVYLSSIKKELGLLGKSSAFGELKDKISETNRQLLEAAARMESLRRRGLEGSEAFKKLEAQFAAGKLEAVRLAESMNNVKKSVTDFSEGSDQASQKVTSLHTEVRQTTEELARMLSAGELTTSQIYELGQGAGAAKKNLDDARKSVRVLSQDSTELAFGATLQGVTALSAGIQGLMSTQALLGLSNEDLQKTLVRLNAVMALTQSLQQIKISLDKTEALSIGATVAGNKALAAVNRLVAATFSSLGIAVEATSVAFKVLRTALITSGIGLIVVAIGYAVDKIMQWTDRTKNQTDAQEELNKKLEEYRQKLDDTFVNSKAEKARQARIRDIDREIKLLEAQGGAEQKILKLRQTRTDLELQSSRVRAATESEYTKVQEEEAEKQKDILNDMEVEKVKTAKASAEQRKKIAEDAAKKALELAQRNSDAEFQITERHLKREVALAKEISNQDNNPSAIRLVALQDFFDKSQALMDAQQANELKKTGLTEAEKKNIEDKYYVERLDLLDDFNKRRTDIIAGDWVGLEKAIQKSSEKINVEFSKDLNNELEGLETVYNMGLLNLQEYEEARQEVQISYSRKFVLNEIKQLEELIENRKQHGQETIELEKALYNERDKLRQADLANFKKDSENATQKAKEDLDQFIHQLDIARKSQIETISLLANSINQTIPDTDAQKVLIGIANLYVQIKNNVDAVAEAQEKYRQGLISLEELNRITEKAHIDSIIAAVAIGQDAISGLFEVASRKRQEELQQQLDMLSQQREAELANKSLTEEQKAAIDERYRRREVQLKRAAYMKDRQSKISQAVINGLLAVTNALATAPNIIAGVALAAVAAATTGLQISKIKSEPIPQFKKGTRSAPKGYAWVGEEGPELVHLRGGEKIWTYKQSEKIHEAWRGGSVASADKILSASVPVVEHELMGQEWNWKSRPSKLDVDYAALGKEIAKNQHPVSVINKIDQDGLALWIEENRNKTNIRNQRYTFNR